MDYYDPEPDDNRAITRVANFLAMGVSKDDIRETLLKDRLSEEEVYLAYMAGLSLWQARENHDKQRL